MHSIECELKSSRAGTVAGCTTYQHGQAVVLLVGIQMLVGTLLPRFRVLQLCSVCVVTGFLMVGTLSGQDAQVETTPVSESPTNQGSAEQSGGTTPVVEVTPNGQNAQTVDNAETVENAEQTGAPQELPEGYQEELDRRIELFRTLRLELEDAITKQREIYIRYANREQHGPQYRRAYAAERNRARIMMVKVYNAALDILRIGFDEEAITYMVTMLQHRHTMGYYDTPTLEGAARLIDGGSKLQYMWEIAARSAIISGQFEMAKNLYDSLPDEDQKEIDLRFEYTLDDLRAEFDVEEKLRQAELEADNLPRVKFKTTQGEFVAELFIDQAPSAVSHFIQLIEDGYYDGKDFYQVIDHLLALAGDPDFSPSDPGVKFLMDEHGRPGARSGMRGSLVMAKVPRENAKEGEPNFFPNSASTQFAILLTPILDAQREQTVFGIVIEGMEAICRLNRVDPHEKKKKGEQEVPPDSIIEATVIRRPDTLPEPVYFR